RIFGEGEPDPAEAAAFDRWLSADPRHQEAFDRTSAAWDLLEPHTAAPEVIRARRDALDYVRRAGGRRWASRVSRRTSFRIAASVAAAAVLGAAAWPVFDGAEVYRTGMGERRQITLTDGSTVSLDSASRVKVRYTADARRLTLLRGQARFDVAQNAARPFSVDAGDRRVVATGTAFNVEILGRAVNVTLLEGSVVVAPAKASAASPVPLIAGQQLMANLGAVPQVEPVKIEDATAWQRGKVVLDNVPLEQAALRVNRYSDRKVVVGDEAAAALTVSGVFQAGDPETFARAMAQYLRLEAEFNDREIVLSSKVSG
ncbi:MAG TPA: FecR domain-containing protein, partial [Arenibaculum sp.]|nr:FecR domain-containing protein [Arenibaculum sp.]